MNEGGVLLKLRDKKEILKSLKNEYEKAELSMLDLFSQTMTKEDLKDIIRYSDYEVKLSLNKPEMSSKLAQAIEEEFANILKVISSTELLELEKLILYNMSFIDLDNDIEFLNLKNKYSLKGFIYFLDSKEHFPEKILVVPKEIINILIENIEKLDFELLEKRENIINIIIGLSNIYGVFEINHLKFIFDNFGLSDIDDNILQECFENSHLFNKIFNKVEEYIVHEACMVDSSFNEINKYAKSKEYYIPTYEEVLRYAEHDLDMERKSYLEVFDYLKILTKNAYFDVNEVAFMVYDLCIMDATVEDIIESINSSGVVFDEKSQLKEMLSLVINLNNDSRKWINRGFTSNELRNKNTDDVLIINKEKKKVGRNDPCPCGSGKKYKKCCMLNDI